MRNRRKAPEIRDLRHRVSICRAEDVVSTDGQMRLVRTGVLEAWAGIVPHRGSYFGKSGATLGGRETPSHKVRLRYRPDVVISAAAWLYEARLQSAPRWYKVLDVGDIAEDGRFWELSVRLVEATDALVPPQAAQPTVAMPLPDGVTL